MNLQLNSEYWNDRYLNNEFEWDIGYVSTPLKNYIDILLSLIHISQQFIIGILEIVLQARLRIQPVHTQPTVFIQCV